MLWDDLKRPWQACVNEAWTAYCKGSLPIGSVVTDAQDYILAYGRNRIHEKLERGEHLSGHRFAHAEFNALLQIDWSKIDARKYILYTTTEPCPLCVGAIRMALISEVHYASRDETAGSAQLFQATPFLRKGNIKVIDPQHPHLEIILVAMLVEYALAYTSENGERARYEQLTLLNSKGAQFGKKLFLSKLLQIWKNEGRAASFVVNYLAQCI